MHTTARPSINKKLRPSSQTFHLSTHNASLATLVSPRFLPLSVHPGRTSTAPATRSALNLVSTASITSISLSMLVPRHSRYNPDRWNRGKTWRRVHSIPSPLPPSPSLDKMGWKPNTRDLQQWVVHSADVALKISFYPIIAPRDCLWSIQRHPLDYGFLGRDPCLRRRFQPPKNLPYHQRTSTAC